MSRILFHSREEPVVKVLGAERAHMGVLTKNIACAVLPTFEDVVRPHLVPGLEVRTGQWFHSDVRLWLGDDRPVFQLAGEPLESFSLILNTAVVVGSDPICLMARLHGQCEIHGYVEGPDRAWLADLIEQGRAVNLLRGGAGWEDVVDLLRSRSDEPVVTSYTVTDWFPNPDTAGWPTEDEQRWDALSEGQRWDLSMAGLRAQSGLTPLTPETLRGHLFGHGRTLLDVFDARSMGR